MVDRSPDEHCVTDESSCQYCGDRNGGREGHAEAVESPCEAEEDQGNEPEHEVIVAQHNDLLPCMWSGHIVLSHRHGIVVPLERIDHCGGIVVVLYKLYRIF